MNHQGRPFSGILHSTDASSGVAVPIFEDGSFSAYTLEANEYLEIHDIEFVLAAGGDGYLHFNSSVTATIATGKTITRGTFGANGGISADTDLPSIGAPGERIIAVAPAGAVDVKIKGTIRRSGADGNRPDWRESQVPGS